MELADRIESATPDLEGDFAEPQTPELDLTDPSVVRFLNRFNLLQPAEVAPIEPIDVYLG